MNIVTSIAQKIQPCTLCGVETFILIEFEWSQWTPPSLLFPSASSYERWNSRESESENGLAQPKGLALKTKSLHGRGGKETRKWTCPRKNQRDFNECCLAPRARSNCSRSLCMSDGHNTVILILMLNRPSAFCRGESK